MRHLFLAAAMVVSALDHNDGRVSRRSGPVESNARQHRLVATRAGRSVAISKALRLTLSRLL
jgi:hypothetical protein